MAYSSIASILGGSQYRNRRRNRGGGGGGGGSYTVNAALGSSGQASVGSPGISVTAASNTPRYTPYAPYSPARQQAQRRPAQEKKQSERRGRGAVLRRVLTGMAMPPGEEELASAARALAPDAIYASRKTGIPASVLLALTGQETAYGTNTGPSSAGARGVAQFIPSTRASHIQKYGVDPWKNARSGLLAAGQYLRDLGFKSNPSGALSSYSGGYAESAYNNPILQRAQTFQPLDRLSRSKAKMPRPLAVSELYHDPGINISDGTRTSPIGGHGSHVHFASTRPRDVLTAARLAQKRGLSVRENPLFDPVDPVHTGGSYHYRTRQLPGNLTSLANRLGGSGRTIGEAIDVSGGTPQDLLAYNRALARRGGAAIPASAGGGTLAAFGGGMGTAAGGAAFSSFARDQRSTERLGRGRAGNIYSPAAARLLFAPGINLGDTEQQTPESLLMRLAEQDPRRSRSRSRRRLTLRDYDL